MATIGGCAHASMHMQQATTPAVPSLGDSLPDLPQEPFKSDGWQDVDVSAAADEEALAGVVELGAADADAGYAGTVSEDGLIYDAPLVTGAGPVADAIFADLMAGAASAYPETIVAEPLAAPGEPYRGIRYEAWERGRMHDLAIRTAANDRLNFILAAIGEGMSPADAMAAYGDAVGVPYEPTTQDRYLTGDQYARQVLTQYPGSPNLGDVDMMRPHDPRAWLAALEQMKKDGTYVGINSGKPDPLELERNLEVARENVRDLEGAAPGSGLANMRELLDWYRDGTPLSNPLIDPLFNPYTGGTSAYRSPSASAPAASPSSPEQTAAASKPASPAAKPKAKAKAKATTPGKPASTTPVREAPAAKAKPAPKTSAREAPAASAKPDASTDKPALRTSTRPVRT